MRLIAATLLCALTLIVHSADKPRVLLETTHGSMTLELYPEKAPKTVENFLGYVRRDFYNGTIFHRVIEDFMIQGGGYDSDLNHRETDAPIPNEADNGLRNIKGAVAMARTSDPHSATAQFFINTVDNPNLDFSAKTPAGWGYTVFGRVIEGMETVERIAALETRAEGPMRNLPVEPVIIQDASVIEPQDEGKAAEQP